MTDEVLKMYLSLTKEDKEKVIQIIDYLLGQQLADQQSPGSLG